MPELEQTQRYPWERLATAFLFVLGLAMAVYLLLDRGVVDPGLISVTFLFVLPAALTALLCWLADPFKLRTKRQYRAVALWFMTVALIASVFILREGTICVIMLMPVWVPSALLGSWLTYKVRHRAGDGRVYCSTLLLAPLFGMAVEPQLPRPTDTVTITRSAVIAASPQRLWPLLEGINDVRPGEGEWNVSQDVLGIPRPVGARLIGHGIGAVRLARWQHGINFREQIIDWQPGRSIGWAFHFDNFNGWDMTDRHLLPDTPTFKVTEGGYRLEPLAPGLTRLTLHTSYRVKTPVNLYARLWGELLMGDLHDNLLALVRQRAERRL